MAIRPEIALEAGKIGQGGPDITGAVERGLKLQQLAIQPALLQQELLNRAQQEELLREQVVSQRAQQGLTAAQTRASEAGTELTRTQTAAESERVRQERIKAEEAEKDNRFATEWLPNNVAKFRDASGRLDVVRLTEAATNEGYAVPALKFQGAHLQNRKQEIDNSKSETERQARIVQYRTESQAMIANQLHAAIQAGVSDDNALNVLNTLASGIDATMPDIKIGSQIAKTLMTPDEKGVLRLDKNKISAARTAGMTVEQQESNNIAKREIALAELQATPEYRNRVAGIPSAELSSTLINTATEINNSVALKRSGLQALNSASELPTRPGAITAQVWNNLVAQKPEYARIQAAIDEYNRMYPPQQGAKPLSIADGLDAVRARLLDSIATGTAKTENLQGVAGAADVRTYQPTNPLPVVTTREQRDALPPGTRYITPDGDVRTTKAK
jgi:hypothetical protein